MAESARASTFFPLLILLLAASSWAQAQGEPGQENTDQRTQRSRVPRRSGVTRRGGMNWRRSGFYSWGPEKFGQSAAICYRTLCCISYKSKWERVSHWKFKYEKKI